MVVKLGVLGCSSVAEKNIFHYLRNTRKFELWSIGSRSKTKASEWANKYSARIFGSYDQVLDSGIDVVYISLPIGLHEEWCIKAAKKGIHIICEKSSTISLASAKKMVEMCSRYNVRLLESFAFRFHPQHAEFKRILNENSNETFSFHGSYGMPSFPRDNIRWQKSLGGGVLNDVGCYPVCAARMFFDVEPISVASKMVFDEASGVEVQIDLMLIFPGNKIAFLSAGFDRYYQSKYNIWGDKVKLELERAYAVPRDQNTKITMEKDDQLHNFEVQNADQFALMFDDFYNSIYLLQQPLFNYEDDLIKQASVMEAIRMASGENRNVQLQDL